uniref:Terpene synthase metal-binding domain-containing protein n=1 Tax=Salix viminalis TaxID=40686 RepID=A0A6N2M5J2_SALVM
MMQVGPGSFPSNNALLTLAGAGLLWTGWAGFNGGDPYTANIDSSMAVLNTSICASKIGTNYFGMSALGMHKLFISIAKRPSTSLYGLKGDVSKSIQCYMHETKVLEEKAHDHIRNLIRNTWKKINDYRFANPRTSQTFIGVAMNLARMAQCMYRYGDARGFGDLETKDRAFELINCFGD